MSDTDGRTPVLGFSYKIFQSGFYIFPAVLIVNEESYVIRIVEIYNYVGGITRFILGELSEIKYFDEDFFTFSAPEDVKVIEENG